MPNADNPLSVLRIDASARSETSTTRALVDQLIARLEAAGPTNVVRRDVAQDVIAPVTEAWVQANFTDPAERSDAQKATLAGSDAMVAELKAADVVVIGSPIYNFSVPAALKAWIDMVCRARETFRYSENGPVGLLEGKKAYIVIASGGVRVDSPVDFTTPYLRHVMSFVGIKDVTVIAADGLSGDAAKRDAAEAAIAASPI